MSEGYLDPKQIYAEELQPWEDFWDGSNTLYENVRGILEQSVLIPDADTMLPIVCSYICVPSKWAKILPILFSHGEKGSGKSTLATFAAKLHGVEIFSAADTFASLRNALDSMRWIDRETKDFEQEGAILCWDNIHTATLLNDQKIYQMLLFGYSRASDRINIASKDGENLTFHVFSPKVMSSVDALHTDMRFSELQRRLIVVKHVPHHKLSKGEQAKLKITEKLDLDSVCWDGLSEEFLGFWSNAGNCRQYAKHRSYLTRTGKRSFTVPPSLKGEQWTVSIDLICTGLLIGTWDNYQEAIDGIAAYWEWAEKNFLNNLPATIKHLASFIEEQTKAQRGLNAILEGDPLVINPSRLKDKMAFLQGTGALEDIPSPKVITQAMHSLGWRLDEQGWVEA